MTRQVISTAAQVVRIRTVRGELRIGPHGRIEGLWKVARRELMTNAQTRKLAGGVPRSTLVRWRRGDFPKPVMTFKDAGVRPVELFSRTEVEAWLRARRTARER